MAERDPYADPDEPTAAKGPTIRESLLKLLTNWGKQANRAQLDNWTATAEEEGLTAEQVAAGVKACIRRWPGENAPQGWAKFAPYVPTASTTTRPAMAWWSEDGDWGGDWSKVGRAHLLFVAATFWSAMRPNRVKVITGFVEVGGERIEESRLEDRDTMSEGGRAHCEEFLRMVYRRRSHPITEGDVLQAVATLNAGGTSALRRFVDDPEGYAEAKADRESMWAGIRAIEGRGVRGEGLPFRRAA